MLYPVWHQKAERVQAHILVCLLAYVLWNTLEQWQRRAGLGSSPRLLLDEMATIQSTDVVLPLAEMERFDPSNCGSWASRSPPGAPLPSRPEPASDPRR